MCSIHASEHSVNIRTNSAFGKIRPSDNFRFRTYAILHCLNLIRIFYNFLLKTCFHYNICHHLIHKKFFKISFLELSGCNTCKNDRRLQLRAKMNCRGYKTETWTAEQLAWNNVDCHWPVCVDWTGGAFVRAQGLRSCQMNISVTSWLSCRVFNPHFGTFGKYSDKFGFRKNSTFG